MIAWGWLIGAAVTLAAARTVAGMLPGIGPADPLAFGAAALFLGLVALIACLQPARRAMRIDPVDALRLPMTPACSFGSIGSIRSRLLHNRDTAVPKSRDFHT